MFFFFKQKTAYEMRISDWSSDVCSSDLGWQIMGIIGDALQAAGGGRPTYAPAMMERQQLETEGRQRLQQLMAQRETKEADRAADLQTWKIKQDYTRENP